MMYTEHGDEVVIQMSSAEYSQLLLLVGGGMGVMADNYGVSSEAMRECVDFVNRLNAGNPHFRPYALIEEVARG
jgi:hypothetical protein